MDIYSAVVAGDLEALAEAARHEAEGEGDADVAALVGAARMCDRLLLILSISGCCTCKNEEDLQQLGSRGRGHGAVVGYVLPPVVDSSRLVNTGARASYYLFVDEWFFSPVGTFMACLWRRFDWTSWNQHYILRSVHSFIASCSGR